MDIVQIIERESELDGFDTVTRVFIEIGSLSCVDPRALRTSFAAAGNQTSAENAVLEIVTKPGQARCRVCDQVFAVTELGVPCRSCGSFKLSIVSGRAIRVTQLEVD